MKQSVFASWFETIGSTATGFVVSIAVQYVVCWWWELPLRIQDNLAIIGLFTVASLIRGFLWRRAMERLHVRRPLSPFMQAVVAERYRQIEQEGWSTDHDDDHNSGELAKAAAAYAGSAQSQSKDLVPQIWPWDRQWWKPADFRRNLVKAGALIMAEGERFDRQKTKRSGS